MFRKIKETISAFKKEQHNIRTGMKLVLATKEEHENGWVFTEETLLEIISRADNDLVLSLEVVDTVLEILLAEKVIKVDSLSGKFKKRNLKKLNIQREK